MSLKMGFSAVLLLRPSLSQDPQPPLVHLQGMSDRLLFQQSMAEMDSPAEPTCKEVSELYQISCSCTVRSVQWCGEEGPRHTASHTPPKILYSPPKYKHQALLLYVLTSYSISLSGGPCYPKACLVLSHLIPPDLQTERR